MSYVFGDERTETPIPTTAGEVRTAVRDDDVIPVQDPIEADAAQRRLAAIYAVDRAEDPTRFTDDPMPREVNSPRQEEGVPEGVPDATLPGLEPPAVPSESTSNAGKYALVAAAAGAALILWRILR